MLSKKIFLILATLIFSMAFAEDSISSVTAQPTKNKKKITFLYIDGENCKYCRNLDALLSQKKFSKILNRYFIVKKVQMNRDMSLPEGLPVPFGSPTVYFLDYEDKALIAPMRGEKSKKELLTFLQEAILENNKLLLAKKKSAEEMVSKSVICSNINSAS